MTMRSQIGQDIASLVALVKRGGNVTPTQMNILKEAYDTGHQLVSRTLIGKAIRQRGPEVPVTSPTQVTPPPPPPTQVVGSTPGTATNRYSRTATGYSRLLQRDTRRRQSYVPHLCTAASASTYTPKVCGAHRSRA